MNALGQNGRPLKTMPVGGVKIGARHRKDMGDIDALAASIEEVGLLQAIAVRPDGLLVAGLRRLEALKKLGWDQVPIRVVSNLEEELLFLKAERDENTCRKDFTPAEAVSVKRAIEEPLKKQAKERQAKAGPKEGPGKKKSASEKFPEALNGEQGETREQIAEVVGISHPTLRKAEEVMEAAEKEPEKFGDLAEQLNKEDAKVDKIHRQFKKREESGDAADRRPTPDEELTEIAKKASRQLVGFKNEWPMPGRVKKIPKEQLVAVFGHLGELKRLVTELHMQVSVEMTRRGVKK